MEKRGKTKESIPLKEKIELLKTEIGEVQITIIGDIKKYRIAFIAYPDWGIDCK